MTLTRRSFVTTVGLGTAGVLGGHILPGGRVLGPWTRGFEQALHAAQAGSPILLHNNENPLGPGQKAIAAMQAKLTEPGVPAARYLSLAGNLSEAIAKKFGCSRENVLVGCGSTQILRTATLAFTSASKPLVGGVPTYEECGDVARLIGAPIRAVNGTRTLHHDLDAMAAAAKGAGLVFFDNPSNPAATLHPASAVSTFVDRVMREDPEVAILFDEAYHDYVTDPGYRSQIPRALDNPRVVVARTFSKAYGLAGLRVGYAIGHPDTIRKMRALQYSQGTNVLGLAAALVLVEDDARLEQEATRNTEARQFTIDWFNKAGLSSTDSQCNFIFANTGRPAREFREACRKHNVVVGRDFPPFEKTHSRISIGTLDEMKTAVRVFGEVLGVKAAAA